MKTRQEWQLEKEWKRTTFFPPEFPTLYFCLPEGILQAADYKTNFKIKSEIETAFCLKYMT